MENSDNILLTQNIHKLFYRYVFNSIMGMMAVSFVILVDTMFIGRGIGADGLSALNICIPIFNVFNGIGLLFGMGGATALSIDIGKGELHESQSVFTQTIFLAITIGISISILGYFNTEYIGYKLGANIGNIDMVKQYLDGVFFFGFSYILVHTIASFVRNDHNPRLVMIATVTGGIINIILDYLFIFKFNMGMKGAALATSIASVTNLLIISTHFLMKTKTLRFVKLDFKISRLARIVSNGGPSFIIEISSGIVIFIFNLAILDMIGEIGVSAYSIIANVSLVAVAIFTGIAQAIQPIISVNFGANNNLRIDIVKRKALIMAFITGSVLYLVGILFPKLIVSIFTTEGGELLYITINAIKYYFIAFLIMGVNIVIGAYYQAIEEKLVSNMISLSRGIIFLIIGIFTLPWIFGVNGIWLTAVFSEIITFIGINIYRFSKNKNTIKNDL